MAKLLYARSCIALAVTATLAACGGSSSSDDNDNTGNGSTEVALITTQVTGQGTITPSSVEIPISSSTTLQVSASENHQLDSISGCNGEINSAETQYVITNISGDCTVNAVFVENDGNGDGDGNGDTGGGNTGGGLQGDNLTVGRSDMSFSAYLVQDDLSPLDITISTENPGERSGSFSLDLSGLDDDAWVLVRAQGGSQLDPDYTGEYTSYIATPDAEIFTLARVSDWNAGANVSAVGDVVWRLSEDWVGKLNLDEFSLRVQRVINALGDGSDWGYESVLGWSMADRRNLEANDSALFVRHQFSDTGSLLKGAEPIDFGYQHYIDALTESADMQQHASVIAGPTIRTSFSGVGEESTLVSFTTLGPSVTESTLDAFNLSIHDNQAQTPITRSIQSHTITAVEDTDEGRVFVRWEGCPNIVDRLTCEFNGLRSNDILAVFEYNFAEFADGYQSFDPHVRAAELDDNTVLLYADSLFPEDITSLRALESGGYIGLYTRDVYLIAEVVSATQNSDGDWVVVHQEKPFDEIFLSGTFPHIEFDHQWTATDSHGNVVTLSESQMHEALSSGEKGISGLSANLRLNGATDYELEIAYYVLSLYARKAFEIHGRDSRVHGFEGLSFGADFILTTEFHSGGRFEVAGALSTRSLRAPTSLSIDRDIIIALGPLFVTGTVSLGPAFSTQAKIEAELPVLEFGHSIISRSGIEYKFDLQRGFQFNPVRSLTFPNSHASVINALEFPDGSAIKASLRASAGLNARIEAGLYGLHVVYGDAGAGLGAQLESKIGKSEGGVCSNIEAGLYTYYGMSAGFDIGGIVGNFLKTCRFCQRVGLDLDISNLVEPVSVSRERSIFSADMFDNPGNCEPDNLLVDINWPEEIEITSTRAPGLSGHTFSNLLRLPGGEWMFEDDFLESLAEMGYDSTEALRVKNTLDEDTIPLWMSLEVNFTDDNLFNWMESPLSLTPSPGLNDSFYRTRDSYLMEPLSVETLGIGINPNLSNTSSLTFNRLSGRSFDFLYTIKDKTQGVEEEEATEVLFTLTHKQPPLIPGRTTYAYRGTNGANQDVKRFAVELTLPSYFENDPRFASLIQAVTVEMRVNGELVSTEPLAEVEFVEGKPLIHGFVNRSGRSGEAFGDRVEITVHYGWDYERQEHTVSRRIAFPPCELDDNDEYDCSLNYSGRWITD